MFDGKLTINFLSNWKVFSIITVVQHKSLKEIF